MLLFGGPFINKDACFRQHMIIALRGALKKNDRVHLSIFQGIDIPGAGDAKFPGSLPPWERWRLTKRLNNSFDDFAHRGAM